MKKKMICWNCKKEVKDNAIYCPYCGKKLKKKKGRILFLICIFLLVLLSAGICFWKLQNDHITKQKEKTGKGENVKYSDGDYVYVPDSESIKVDEKVEIVYYDNLITVYLEKNTSDEEKEALAKLLDGDIVSNISGCINMIEVEVESTDYSGIQKKIGNILDEKCVQSAMCSIPVAIENETSKVWNGESDLGNESDPKGADWWAEAVGAYTAWDYDSLTDSIVVGVVDNGFEVMHEDLQRDEKSVITMLNENSIDMKKNSPEHGTHVVGLIGAQDNSIGMRGIADKAEIVCADWQLSDGTTLLTPAAISKIYESMIEYAKKQNKPIVINNSWGTSMSILYMFSRVTAYGEEHMPKEYKFLLSCVALEIMEQLLEADSTDFIIVQAAGNGYSNGLVGYNAEESGWFCGITPQLKEQYKKRFSQSIYFTYETIKSHIMIVGAVQNNKNQGVYQMTGFSNYGDSVDIVAPGKKIYSTVLKNKYGYLEGTSMAAPIVSGAAAYLWSLNRELSANEIKQKLIDTAGKAHGVLDNDKRKEYPMLNIGAAATAVIQGNVTCKIIDAKTKEVLSDVVCTRKNDISDSSVYTMDLVTTEEGMINASAIGTTTFTFSKTGYKTEEIEFDVKAREEIDLGTVELMPILEDEEQSQTDDFNDEMTSDVQFSEEQINTIKEKFGIPDEVEIEVVAGKPWYWEGTGVWLVNVELYDKDGTFIIGAAINTKTLEPERDITAYSDEWLEKRRAAETIEENQE